MNRLVRLAVLGAMAIGLAGAQTKVGIVNSQKAMLDTAEIKKAQIDLENKYKPRQDKLAQLQQELQTIQQQLSSGKVTPAQQQDLQAEGQRKQREMQRDQQDLQDDVDRDRNDILARTSQHMRDIVTKLAAEKGLDVVIDAGNTIYFKPALDLTAEATAAYDKAYPVAAAPGK